jgi:outer membrane protein, protease secretion system
VRLAGLILALATAACCFPLHAQQARTASPLVEAFRAALAFDPGYRAARQEQLAAQEGIALAAGARRPEVAFTGAASLNSLDQRAGPVSRSPEYTGNNVAVQLRQPIINRDIDSREAQARLRATQADAVLAVRRLELGERLVNAYVELAHANGVVELTRADLERQLKVVEAARRSLAGREGTVTEVLEASSLADVLRAQLGAAENARLNAIETLRAITGPTVAAAPRLARRPPEPPGDASAGAIDAALSAHPEVVARQLEVELARENINAARAPYRPRLDWSLSAARSDSDVVNTVNQVNTLRSLGVQFTVPLYSGGRDDAATRQAALLAGRAEAGLDETRETVRLKMQHALRGLASSGQRWQALQSARASTTQLISATSRSIAGGVRSRLDLLIAERQLVQVLREEQQVLADHAKAWWRLAAARGDAGEPQL